MQTRSPTLSVVTSRAGLDHHAGGLVAEDHRRADDEGADAAVGVVVHVRAADADGVQLDAHVAGAERLLALDGEVAERELVLFFEDEGLHGMFSLTLADDDDAEREHEDVADPERDPRGSRKRIQKSSIATPM